MVHGDDLAYLLKIPRFSPHHFQTLDDLRMQKLFMQHVMSFIRFSDPGYPAWDLKEPEITHFVRSGRGVMSLQQLPAKRHEFWTQIQDIYESADELAVDLVGNFSLIT